MKIVAIETFPMSLRPPGSDGLGSRIATAHTVIVRLRTDTGMTGLGEAAASACDANRTLFTLLSWLKAYEMALSGADALNINNAHRLLDRPGGQYPPGCQVARAAIDMALHDLIGKARGCPVHQILGGAYRSKVELLADIGGGSPQAASARARSAVGRGFRSLKISIGDETLPPAQSITHLEEKCLLLLSVLEAVGPEISVIADANQSLGNPALVSRMFETVFARRFYANLGLQQPLHQFDLMSHNFLREKLPIPIILSEPVVSPEAMMQIERAGAADRIALSIERIGGLNNAMRIADICEAAAIGISPAVTSLTGIGAAAHYHLAATLHDPYPVDIGEYLHTLPSPVVGGPQIRNGYMSLDEMPGLGVELDEDLLHAMTMGTDEFSQLRQTVG